MKPRVTPRFLTMAAVIAALYVVLAGVFAPISFGQIQFRIAEVLVLLPIFTSAAIPGVAIGCLLSNVLFGGLGPVDWVLGTLATLLAAVGTHLLRRWLPLVPIPPIALNALIVGAYLPSLLLRMDPLSAPVPILLSMGYVAVGETAVLYILGLPLMLVLRRVNDRIRLFRQGED